MSWLAPVVGVIIAIAALTVLWGVFVERNRFILRQYALSKLPKGKAPLRVLHISDIHLAPWQKRRSAWVASLAQLKPDLVVMTGDSMGHMDALPAVEKTLEAFQGIPGVFVFGSNDYHGPKFKNPVKYFLGPSKVKKDPEKLDVEAQRDFLTQTLGWVDLNNHAGELNIAGTQIQFLGVDDPHHKLDDFSRTLQEAKSLNTSEITIGVSHAPYQRVLNEFMDHGAEIIFCGHTHGGQICTPWFSTIVTNCDIPRSQAKGLSTWHHNSKKASLFVSAGIGTSIFAPIRLFCRPEASLIALEAGN